MNMLPYVRTLHKLNSNSKFPAGHFYSSVVSLEEMRKRQDEIWPAEMDKTIPGIDINEREQLKLLTSFAAIYPQMDFPENRQEGRRYFLNNSYFAYNDGIILYLFLRYFKPKRVIEIGSGFSSAVMLDIQKRYLDKMELTFIEPYPEVRLKRILGDETGKEVKLVSEKVQDVDLEEFTQLKAGDILFIDSSHIIKTGSDVNFILFKVLPRLQKGVLIHFHDIHFPFEYPKPWVLDGFGWNETYFIRAFLSYNSAFSIRFFSDFLHKFHGDAFKDMPLTYKSTGSSLWLEKVQ